MEHDWKREAACRHRSVPTDWFFSSGGYDHTHRALAVCRVCPVQKQCLDFALSTSARGVWGGTTDIERQQLRRARVSG